MTTRKEDPRSLDDLKEDARVDGRRQGREAVRHCEVGQNELYKRWKESGDQRALQNAIAEEATLAENNSRQYSGHPINEIGRLGLGNSEYGDVTHAYEEGVSEGIEEGLPGRMEEEIAQRIESLTAEDALRGLRNTEGIDVMGSAIDPRRLVGFFEDYDLSLEDARKVAEIWEGKRSIQADYFYHRPDRSRAALMALSEALGYHGVESVRDGRGGPVLYDYANSGDTVLPEMFWMHGAEVWVLTDMETLASRGDPRLFHTLPVEL